MKFAQRISSIRRSAWKACSSCSPASRSMCAASLASSALAGMDRLAARLEHRRHRRLGEPLDLEARAPRGAARRRWRRRARRGRGRSARRRTARASCAPGSASTVGLRGGRAATRDRRRSRSSRLNATGSRACGPWPAPSNRTSSPPVSSASAHAAVVADDVVVRRRARRAPGSAPAGRAASTSSLSAKPMENGWPATSTSARRVERPGDAVLDLLGRVRLREDLAEEELEEAAVVAQPVVPVVLRPALVGVELLVEGAAPARVGSGGAMNGTVRADQHRAERPGPGDGPPGAARTAHPATRRRRTAAVDAGRVEDGGSVVGELDRVVAPARRAAGRRAVPRPSKVTTRKWRARYGIWPFQCREWTIDHAGAGARPARRSPKASQCDPDAVALDDALSSGSRASSGVASGPRGRS